MAQFDVYTNPGESAARAPYLLDLQPDFLDLATRVLAPLVEPAYFGEPIGRLNPLLTVQSERLVLSPGEITAVLARDLSRPVANLGERRNEILAALDTLFTGI